MIQLAIVIVLLVFALFLFQNILLPLLFEDKPWFPWFTENTLAKSHKSGECESEDSENNK